MADIYIHLSRSGHQSEQANSFEAGFCALGHNVIRAIPDSKPSTVVTWGWRTGKDMRAKGHNVIVAERGYLGDRFHYTSVGLNGLNGRATFSENPRASDLFDQRYAHLMRPWNPAGDYVLICGQVPGDASLQGRDLNGWYLAQAEKFVQAGMDVVFRPHPLGARKGALQKIPKCRSSFGALEEDLENAALVITYNSNSGVDALMAGKIATCDNEGSMIYGWDGTEAGRESLLRSIAGKQFTPEEIASGEPLERLLWLMA